MEYIKKYVEKTNSFLMEIYINDKESFSYVTLPKEALDIYTHIDQFHPNNGNVVLNLSQNLEHKKTNTN